MQKRITPPKLTAQTGLKRHSDKRTDATYIAAASANPDAKVLALFDLRVPVLPSFDRTRAQLRWLSVDDVEAVAKPIELVFLGGRRRGRRSSLAISCRFKRRMPGRRLRI